MVTDYDTSHELRAAEIRNLQNSFEEEISMVSLLKLDPTQNPFGSQTQPWGNRKMKTNQN